MGAQSDMRYYEVNMQTESGLIFIDIFKFENKYTLMKYFSLNFPHGVTYDCRELEEDEAKVRMRIRKRELSKQVRDIFAQLDWNKKEEKKE